ncbi:MAG: putative flagella basal body P-ring formation protein FlgA [Pseudomonadota bacterium]|jgi:flagella basal body P-ring formation protein FlgA
MKRITSLIIAGVLMAGAVSADAATLRTSTSVDGTQIRLGDLFEGLSDEQAERVVTAAPEPGRRLVLDPAALGRIAAAHGLDWRPVTGADRIMVDRASQSIGPDAIRQALTDALADAGIDGDLELTLDNRTLTLHLPASADSTLLVEKVAYDGARGRVTAELVLPAAGIIQTVSARAVEVVEVPVLSRRVMPGEVITMADIAWTTLPRDRTGSDTITTAEEMIGQTVRRGLPADRPLRAQDLRAQVVVARGAMVTILLETPTMSLTAQGRALADGAVGEVIRVANANSNRVIEAKVAADGLVTVLPAGLSAATAPAPTRVGTPIAYHPGHP